LTDTAILISAAVFQFSKNTTYYWHVCAKNASGEGAYSSAWSFITTSAATPAQPTLVSPANNALNVNKDTVAFNWNDVTGASYYVLQVARTNDFSNLVVSLDSLTVSNYTLINKLGYDSTYYWRVQCHSKGGYSPWSVVRYFSTGPSLPPKVALIAPANTEGFLSVNPLLVWAKTIRTERYIIQVSTDTTLTPIVFTDTITSVNDTDVTVSTTLLNNSKYFWRVCAGNVSGLGPWSDVRSFKTRLEQPILLLPANNATNVALPVTFSWRKTPASSSYRLQIATDINFNTIVLNNTPIPDSFYTCTTLLSTTQYYWHIRAYNATDSSAWSIGRTFTTTLSLPQAPVLTTPADSAINVAPQPRFEWLIVPTATSYIVEISDSWNFGTVVSSSTTSNIYLNLTNVTLANLTRYYWRVKAYNSIGWGPYSIVRTFKTVIDDPSAPVLVAPVNNEDSVRVPVNFVWKKANLAESYRLQVRLNTTVILDTSGIKDTAVSIGTLAKGTTYTWQIGAKNAAGTIWSVERSLSTIFKGPAAPVLVAPAVNATNVPVKATFIWRKVPLAQYYSIQVSTTNPFTTVVFEKDSVKDTTTTSDTLVNNTKYYWHVRSRNKLSELPVPGAWSAVDSFTTVIGPPAVPVLVSPVNGEQNLTLNTTLTWTIVTNAVSYSLQVSKRSDCSTTVINKNSLTAVTYPIAAGTLENNTTYYWRVNATNSNSTSAWSAIWSFRTLPTIPATPALVLPANDAKDQPIALSVSWNSVVGADSFSLQIATMVAFDSASIVLKRSGLTTASCVVNGLLNGTKYFWRVNACNAAGISPWSAIWSFTTIVAGPIAPVLAMPLNNSENQPVNLNLTWNAVTNASSYELQVATDNTFNPAAMVTDQMGITAVSYAVTNLSYLKKYFWRVNATNVSGVAPWSETWTFTTIVGPPVAPVLTSPTNGVTNQRTTVIFTWNTVPDVTSYKIQVSRDADFATDSLVCNLTTVSTTHTVNGLFYNRAYYWRVSATNSTGAGPWSTVWSFTTEPPTGIINPAPGKQYGFMAYPAIASRTCKEMRFTFKIPAFADAEVVIYDGTGSVIARPKVKTLVQGHGSVTWDLTTGRHTVAATGTYCAILKITDRKTSTVRYAKTMIGIKR
jgi:hypothetical protein